MKYKGKGTNPNSKKALEPGMFKKGQKAPAKAGRPKGSLSLKERMERFVELKIKVKMPDGSIKDQAILDSIIMSMLSQAQQGNMVAVKEVFDRFYGKQVQPIDVTNKEDSTTDIEERIKKYAKPD